MFIKAGASKVAIRSPDSLGLFDPGDVPNPTMETFTKDMENWEKTAPGVEHWERNHGGIERR